MPNIPVITTQVPEAYAGQGEQLASTLRLRLLLTSECPNGGWHLSAPARMLELCPECTPAN
jgi:hypothetical protein